jgi:hypothetical protein
MTENISVTLIKEVLNKHKRNHTTFVETGTYLGGSVSTALECGFETIYSIDISDTYKERNKWLFKTDIALGKVRLLYGDSVDVLPDVMKNIINTPSVFWLDAHFDIFSDKCGKYKTPILKELECISISNVKNHTIMIDDVRMFKNNKEWDVSVTLDDIVNMLMKINPNYKIVYEDGRDDDKFRKNDVLVAYI